MDHQVTWYLGQRIVYASIEGNVLSAQDAQDINDRLIPYIRHSDAPYVHVIIDASSVKSFQNNLTEQVFSYLREPQLGWNILISTDSVAKHAKKLFSRMGSIHFQDFTSLEEGMFFLEDVDRTLLMPA